MTETRDLLLTIKNIKLFTFYSISISLIALALFIPLATVHAKKTIQDAPGFLNETAGKTGVEQTDVPSIAGTVIQAGLGATGIIFFVLVVYAGFKWMMSQGNSEQIEKSRDTIVAAGIGLVIVIAAYAVTNFVTTRIIEGKKSDGSVISSGEVGCCFDKVGPPPGNSLEGGTVSWAWRTTTPDDCQSQGETPTSLDGLVGPGTWQFDSIASSAGECKALYDVFCEKNDCFDVVIGN